MNGSRMTARVSFARGLAVITVNLEPQPNDRHLYVAVESDNSFQSGYRQLDSKRRQFRFEWRLQPDGLYVIEARIRNQRGDVTGTAHASLQTMPRP